MTSQNPSGFDFRGISVSTYSLTGYEGSNLDTILADAVTVGANYVEFSNEPVIDVATGVISDWIENGFNHTAKFSDIGHAVQLAQSKGLNVMLKPQIAAYDPQSSQFTGSLYSNLGNSNLVITNPDAFFAGYKTYILEWAALAQQDHVPLLSIGNEMLAATKPQYTPYWDDIISSIRQIYTGKLTYSALLGLDFSFTAGNEAQQIQFWDKLDYVGLDVYPTLASQADPSITALNAAWHANEVNGRVQDVYQFISTLAANIGRPVIFTETGIASSSGANDKFHFSDSKIGDPNTIVDYSEQVNYWESFFETWSVQKPAWLLGAFAWDNDPGGSLQLSNPFYSKGYVLIGKPADLIISAWYGGGDYLASSQHIFVGSVASDNIYLYGNENATALAAISAGQHVSEPDTFNTNITVALSGNIIGGAVPSVHVYINGIDFGSAHLTATPGSFVDAAGVHWTAPQDFTFSLPTLTSITELKLVYEGPVSVGGPENLQTFFNAIDVNGTPLVAGTYHSATGSIFSGLGQFNGGYTVVDASPFNSALGSRNIGSPVNPIDVSGHGGSDIANVLGNPGDYVLGGLGTSQVTLSEHSSLGQNAVLHDVSFIRFQDGSIMQIRPDEVVIGGPADDMLSGGPGNDTILGQDGNDTISGDAGDDRVNGGLGNDVIFGGAGNDELGGGAGNDTIVGQDGNDVIFGEDGADVANGGAGNDVMLGGTGNDTFGGGADNDVLLGGNGDDLLFGEDGVDNMNGEFGNDGVVGGAGDDLLGGGPGNDIVVGDDGNDVLFGEAGNDAMNGGFGNDVLIGSDGDDVLGGGAGDDDLNGGFGNDTLFGENGNDILNGSAGNDILIGGGNDDTFVLQPGDGADTIADFFAGGLEDHIWFKGTDLHSFADVQAHAATVAGNTVITYNGFFTVTLNGVTAGQLTAGDFVFT